MSVSRRDFIKMFGVSIASLMLTRCKFIPPINLLNKPTTTPTVLPPRGVLRSCWQRFNELAQTTQEISEQGEDYNENVLGNQLIADHHQALAEVVATGELTQPVADLVKESYEAAIYHVWRSNIPVTCYEPVMVDYGPISAYTLVQQANILSEYAQTGEIEAEILASAGKALEHDMNFIAMRQEDIDSLYRQLLAGCQDNWECIPKFDALDLEPSADAKAAAQFIIELLTEK
jgi:hypothetical protein